MAKVNQVVKIIAGNQAGLVGVVERVSKCGDVSVQVKGIQQDRLWNAHFWVEVKNLEVLQ